jgi:hypothetical protein
MASSSDLLRSLETLMEAWSMSSGGVVSIDCKKSMSKEEVNRLTEPGTMSVGSNGTPVFDFGSGDPRFRFDFLLGVMNFLTLDIFIGGEVKLATDSELTDVSSSQLVDVAGREFKDAEAAALIGWPATHRSRCKNSLSDSEQDGKAYMFIPCCTCPFGQQLLRLFELLPSGNNLVTPKQSGVVNCVPYASKTALERRWARSMSDSSTAERLVFFLSF